MFVCVLSVVVDIQTSLMNITFSHQLVCCTLTVVLYVADSHQLVCCTLTVVLYVADSVSAVTCVVHNFFHSCCVVYCNNNVTVYVVFMQLF